MKTVVGMKICRAYAHAGSSPADRTQPIHLYMVSDMAVVLIRSKLVIEQVKKSPYWRMRYKSPEGKWTTFPTKKETEDEAAEFARNKYREIKVLATHGIAQGSKTVEDIANIYISNIDAAIADGSASTTYEGYKQICNNWVIPFLGDKPVNGISNEVMAEFESARRQKFGKEMKKGTISQHNTVFRNIFQIAKDKKYITADQIPTITIKGKGVKGESRAGLELVEYRQFNRFLRTYPETATRYVTKYKRRLYKEMLSFQVMTGARPGTEVETMKWSAIDEKFQNKYVQVLILIGKTDEREVIARHGIRRILRNIRAITGHVKPDDLVFCFQDGSPLKDMSGMVGRILTDAGLRHDKLGKTRTAYVGRHAYATLNIIYKGLSFEELSVNMGNSPGMIATHYSHVKSSDIAERLAGSGTRKTSIEKRLNNQDLMMKNQGEMFKEIYDAVKELMKSQSAKDNSKNMKFVTSANPIAEIAEQARDKIADMWLDNFGTPPLLADEKFLYFIKGSKFEWLYEN